MASTSELMDAVDGINGWAAAVRHREGLPEAAPVTVNAPPALTDEDLATLRLLVGPNIMIERRLA